MIQTQDPHEASPILLIFIFPNCVFLQQTAEHYAK